VKTISSYNRFLEEKKVNDVISFIDNSINESLDIKDIWNNVLNKIKNLSEDSKKKILNHTLATLLTISVYDNVVNMVKRTNMDKQLKEFSIGILNNQKGSANKMAEDDKWKRGYEFTLSQDGWNHIKKEESLRLTAYSIGDGMITVGWGHAEPFGKSKYKIGDKISEEEARKLLKEDLNYIADGVRRIFIEWEEEGIDVKITQDMFDALVSIAFNTGVGALRRSELMQELKKGNHKVAGEKIKKFRVSNKFPGLYDRREKESQMFLASL
jgi:lysozyme